MNRPLPAQDIVGRTLADDRLGVPAVLFFVMSAAAPLTVVAGVVTTGFAVTGITGVPLAFVVVGAVLTVFSVGYVAMARYTANAGAFYAYVARGLGRPAGVGAAWVALLAYNCLQAGLYGAIGAAAGPLLDGWFGLNPPWWGIALASWVLVAVLGLLRVDVNGTVLAVLLLAEVAVIVAYDAVFLANPAGGTVTLTTLEPGNLFVPGMGAVLVLALLGFTGFESSVVFAEESKDPRRTVPLATYASVALIAGLYALSSWAMTVAVGPADVVRASREQGPEVIFNLAAANLGPTAASVGHALFATSLVAAMISFHNTCARYFFAVGRERVLPKAFGAASERTGAPKIGSLAQSAIGLGAIVLYAVMGWDPIVRLFFWLGTGGGFGVLTLITVTSLAVVVFFVRTPNGENAWRTAVAPTLATVALAAIGWLAVANFATLLGVPPGHPARWAIPGAYLIAAILGVTWGLVLRATRPEVYAGIGLGADAVFGRTPSARRVGTGGRR